MANYLIGVDIGTYESKGVLVDLEGTIICSHSIGHELLVSNPGWAEHDAEKIWWGDFCKITKAIIEKGGIDPKRILSVGCSAIAPDVLPIDRNGNPLRNGILYGIDTRAWKEIEELEWRFGKHEIFRKCGNELTSQSVGPKVLWIKKHERDIYDNAYKFVTATSFIVGRLTDHYVIDHYTAAAGFTPFYNIELHDWDPELCESVIEIDRLPDLCWSTDICGYVTEKAAFQTGLQVGTPVITGTADAAAEAVSVGTVRPGDTMLMYGSTFFLIGVSNVPIKDRRLWSAPYLFPDTYSILGGMSTTGALTRWFRDMAARDLMQEEKMNHTNAYSLLAKEAESISPGADGLLVLPYFSGERTPIHDPLAKGVFFGLTLWHTRAHMFRALLEGIGHGIKHNLDILSEVGFVSKRLISVGGGTKNPLWLQIVSDISGQNQFIPDITIGASYGNCFLAGLGTGVFSSIEQIDSWVNINRKIIPNNQNGSIYEKDHKDYLQLYNATKTLMHERS